MPIHLRLLGIRMSSFKNDGEEHHTATKPDQNQMSLDRFVHKANASQESIYQPANQPHKRLSPSKTDVKLFTHKSPNKEPETVSNTTCSTTQNCQYPVMLETDNKKLNKNVVSPTKSPTKTQQTVKNHNTKKKQKLPPNNTTIEQFFPKTNQS